MYLKPSTIPHICRQELDNALLKSPSLRELARNLGYHYGPQFTKLIRARLAIEGLEFKSRSSTRSTEDILKTILIEKSPASRSSVRKYAKDRKIIPYECRCGNGGEWLGAVLKLELHHRNGEPTDNRPSNLEFVCPNCHSQEPTTNRPKTPSRPRDNDVLAAFPLSRHMRDLIRRIGMIDNGANYRVVKRILKENGLSFARPQFSTTVDESKEAYEQDLKSWRKAPRPDSRKVQRPSKEFLEKLVWEKSVVQIAKEHGVSSGAVEKWCSTYGITSKPPRGYWAKRTSGMTHNEALLPPKPKGKIPERKLTEEQVSALLDDIARGENTMRGLSRRYGICRRTLCRIRDRGGYAEQMALPAGV